MNDGSAAPSPDATPSLLGGVRTLLAMTGPRRRFQLLSTMVLMIFGAFAELLTIGAVLPLLAIVADPTYLNRLAGTRTLLDKLGLEASADLILPAAIFLVGAALLSAILRSLLSWASQKFVFGMQYDISMRIFSRLLRQPYEVYVSQNSSTVLASVEKTYIVTVGLISPLLLAVTSSGIASCIVVFLFLVDPISATIAALSMGLIYVGISLVCRRILFWNSRRTAQLRTQRLQIVQEIWGGMRDIILDHSQAIFEGKLAKYEEEMRRLQVVSNFTVEAPRFLVESFGITLVALLAVYFSWQPGGVLAAIPILGALALGAQRLLPLIQAIYRGWASFSINAYALKDVIELMNAPVSDVALQSQPSSALPQRLDIELRDVWFSYSAGDFVLKSINLTIRPGERVGFIGKTGSGKSTLVDVLMGLLTPTKGQIIIGNDLVDRSNINRWHQRIAHVPQAIFLTDDTISANIAFGSGDANIDEERVREAAERADILQFVEQLPQLFQTRVGERGIRLSGGQKQRIGIARALYKNASVLILDEATSALDEETEAAVMSAVAGLDRKLTVILIAHRLSTVAGCDKIYRLEGGRIVEAGSYQDVVLRERSMN